MDKIDQICFALENCNILKRGDRVVEMPDGRVGLDIGGRMTYMSRDILLALIDTFDQKK